MKKLLSLYLAIVLMLSFTGCDEKNTQLKKLTTYPNSDLLYPASLNLEWGMSKEEAFNALGVSADQALLYVFDESQLEDGMVVLSNFPDRDAYSVELVFDGAKICAILRFTSQAHIDEYGVDYGLIAAEIAFSGEDLFDKVKADLPKEPGKKIAEACETAGITDAMLKFLDTRLNFGRDQKDTHSTIVDPLKAYGDEHLAGATLGNKTDKSVGVIPLVGNKEFEYEYKIFYRGINAAFYNVTILEK